MASVELQSEKSLGFYQLTPQEFETEIMAAIENYKNTSAMVKTLKQITWESAIHPLEVASERLDRLWHLLDHENAVNNSDEIRAVYEKLLPLITNLHTDTVQDDGVYKIFLAMHDSPEFAKLVTPQKAIITHAIRNFKLGGVNLPKESRDELKDIQERLSMLESKFANNVLDATQSWTYHITTAQKFLLDGLPERLIADAAERAIEDNKSGWVLGLDSPTVYDVLDYAQNRQLREEFYQAYYGRASAEGPTPPEFDNTEIIAQILALRQQLAKLCGYANYAEYSLVPKMADSTEEVNKFLNDMITKVLPYAKTDYANLQKFAKDQGFAEELEAWDAPFYSHHLREQKYQVNEEALRQYFPVPRVMQGLFDLAGKLFGIHITEEKDFVSWNPLVQMFKVTDSGGKLRGYFYVDLYTREGKRGGAWMAECTHKMNFSANVSQAPIAYLTCNFPPPSLGKPGLLSHSEVLILFHEFGHTMHHVLTQIEYYSVSGMSGVEWDAIELPSQLMENWAWEWEVIQNISENIHNGEPMPRDIFNNLVASKNFNSGLFLSRQLLFSMFDFRIHENLKVDAGKDAHEILEDLRAKISVMPTPSSNRFENGFSHIFCGGYSAGYYSYLWAEVLSCDAYDKLTANNLVDSKAGKEFMSKILEKGGSEPAMDLFVSFLGRKPAVDALLKHHALA